MILSKEYYLERFAVSVEDMESLTARALRSGGDYCDLYFEDTSYFELLLRDSHGLYENGDRTKGF